MRVTCSSKPCAPKLRLSRREVVGDVRDKEQHIQANRVRNSIALIGEPHALSLEILLV